MSTSLSARRAEARVGPWPSASRVGIVTMALLLQACGGGGGESAPPAAVPTVDSVATVDDATVASWPALGASDSFTRDIATCRVEGSPALVADLARPPVAAHRRRAVLYVHGGGWSSGSKSDYEPLMRSLAAQGFTGLTVDYRLSPAVKHPTHLMDVQCHLRWLRANATRLDIDVDRIAVVGGSAGAHLAGLLAFDLGNSVRAAVLHAGPYDLRPGSLPASVLLADIDALLGTASPTLDQLVLASPIFRVNAAAPPTLIVHGRLDPLVPVAQALGLSAAMVGVGQLHQLLVIEGAGHSDFGPMPEAVGQAILIFLETVLR